MTDKKLWVFYVVTQLHVYEIAVPRRYKCNEYTFLDT